MDRDPGKRRCLHPVSRARLSFSYLFEARPERPHRQDPEGLTEGCRSREILLQQPDRAGETCTASVSRTSDIQEHVPFPLHLCVALQPQTSTQRGIQLDSVRFVAIIGAEAGYI